MESAAFAVVESSEAVSLLESPLSPAETAELQSCELAIELAGKDRLEKALIIGEKLSTIYNGALFRGVNGGCSWEQWLKEQLPKILPESADRSTAWADGRRALWEQRRLLTVTDYRGELPSGIAIADNLKGLIPRKYKSLQGWNPAILDDPDAAQGVAKVWELSCITAKLQGRKEPNVFDVRAAREELRPALQQQGLIRSAPASFQAATAARVEAARHRTVTVAAIDPAEEERKAALFRDTIAKIRDTKAERQANVEVDEVSEQISAAEREQRLTLEQEVRTYNARLHSASTAIHDLLGYLQTISRTHGTQLLNEMRCIDVLGLITVKDDMPRLQEMGQELMAVVRLAQSSDPSTGINAQTIEL